MTGGGETGPVGEDGPFYRWGRWCMRSWALIFSASGSQIVGEEGRCDGFLSTAKHPALEGPLACSCRGVRGRGDGVKKQTRRLQGLGSGRGQACP